MTEKWRQHRAVARVSVMTMFICKAMSIKESASTAVSFKMERRAIIHNGVIHDGFTLGHYISIRRSRQPPQLEENGRDSTAATTSADNVLLFAVDLCLVSFFWMSFCCFPVSTFSFFDLRGCSQHTWMKVSVRFWWSTHHISAPRLSRLTLWTWRSVRPHHSTRVTLKTERQCVQSFLGC